MGIHISGAAPTLSPQESWLRNADDDEVSLAHLDVRAQNRWGTTEAPLPVHGVGCRALPVLVSRSERAADHSGSAKHCEVISADQLGGGLL